MYTDRHLSLYFCVPVAVAVALWHVAIQFAGCGCRCSRCCPCWLKQLIFIMANTIVHIIDCERLLPLMASDKYCCCGTTKHALQWCQSNHSFTFSLCASYAVTACNQLHRYITLLSWLYLLLDSGGAPDRQGARGVGHSNGGGQAGVGCSALSARLLGCRSTPTRLLPVSVSMQQLSVVGGYGLSSWFALSLLQFLHKSNVSWCLETVKWV
jgi:hypothetical protein